MAKPADNPQPSVMRQFRLFDLFGFEVKMDLSWLLLGLLISWSLGAGHFPRVYPDLPSSVYAWMGVAVAIGVLFSIVFHEFAHSVVARAFGMPIRGITLFIFGGVAEMEKEPPSPRSEFLMAIAGPIASFVLAFVFDLAERALVAANGPVAMIGVCATLALINLTVAIFNLIPAFPLDGGRMLRAALWHWLDNLRRATFISSQLGKAFGLGLMILGVIGFASGNIVGGMWWFLIGLFVRGAAASAFQQLVVSEMIEDKPVSHFMRRELVTVPPDISIESLLNDYVYRHHFKMYPVVERGALLGCITLADIKPLSKELRAERSVADLMQPVSDANTVPADQPTSKALADMMQPARARYMVVDDGRLVGIIALKDLLELLALRMELERT